MFSSESHFSLVPIHSFISLCSQAGTRRNSQCQFLLQRGKWALNFCSCLQSGVSWVCSSLLLHFCEWAKWWPCTSLPASEGSFHTDFKSFPLEQQPDLRNCLEGWALLGRYKCLQTHSSWRILYLSLVILTECLRFSGLQPTHSYRVWSSQRCGILSPHELGTLSVIHRVRVTFYKLLNKIPPLYMHTPIVHHSQDSHRNMAEFFWQSNWFCLGFVSAEGGSFNFLQAFSSLSLLNIQNFPTEVSSSFLQKNIRVALAAWSICTAQNNEGEFFPSFPLTSEQPFLGVTHLFTMVMVTISLIQSLTY